MAQNVKFYTGTRAQYDSLISHNPHALYFCDDTGELFKGDVCLSDGIRIVPTRADLPDCSCAADGIVYFIAETKSGYMVSPDRTEWLQTIYAPVTDAYVIPEEEMYTTVTTVGAVRDIEAKIYNKIEEIAKGSLSTLTAVDGTINIADTENGGKAIGVAIASIEGNTLTAVDGGLFVPAVVVPEYAIEKQLEAEDGFAVSYKLKKTVDGEVSYVGDVINIAKDLVLQSATLEVVTEDGSPYAEAKIGDPYIKMVFNDSEASNLYVPVSGLVDTYTAGSGIEIIDNKISIKLAPNTHGLVAVDGALTLNLASRKSDGAMSKEDKLIVDSIPYVYETRKYDISGTPVGTLVDYRDHEIRVMCPSDAEFTKQTVGANGNPNMYYLTFKAYAPEGAVSFKEGDRGVIVDEMFGFNGPASGIDEFGRKYSVVWLALASYDSTSNTWNYYGKGSSESKYIGWDYVVEWYNADGIKIGFDSVRINLSNESCHNINRPYYMTNFATTEEIEIIKESIVNVSESYMWGEM